MKQPKKGEIAKVNSELSTKSDNIGLQSFDALSIINSKEVLDSLVAAKMGGINSTKHTIIAAVLTGREFGISPMKSILLAPILTPRNAPKIEKGLSLGMDIVEAVNSIYEVEGRLVVGGNATIGVLRRNGIDVIIEKDAEPVWKYVGLSGKWKGKVLTEETMALLGDDLVEKSAVKSQEDLVKIKKEKPNAVFYDRTITDWETQIRFIRKGFAPHVGKFTYSEAVASGYVHDSEGNIKPAWRNKRLMLRHKVIGPSGRFIAGDILGTVYTPGEIGDIMNVDAQEIIEMDTIKPKEDEFNNTVDHSGEE